jgi:hypothetical protein
VMTLGATRDTGALELLGTEQPGLPRERIVTTATTRLAQGIRTRTGSDVLVDVEHDGGERVAVFVRGLAPPHQVDVARFEAALAAFRRAGVPRLVRAPVHDAVRAVFAQLLGPFHDTPTHPRLPWDPRDYLTTVFLHRAMKRDEIFPTMWWDDDPSTGIDEMAGLLKLHGVVALLPRKQLIAEAVEELHQLDSTEAARDALCARLCELANRQLAKAGTDRRFCGPYFCDFNDGEPNWLLTTPAQHDGLVAEKLLVPWDPDLRVPVATPYKRPPDLGEIDFSTFPSGDDPF